ncbi:hypothetical protein [Spiroplasma poulsonii]|uniref:hypothetical protein n=1 Tax=Spiroplasma poulsonii TaxID=2138 RepID=UPI0010570870|nr:hypothetical protein [Spiroplasma poulsonii]
MKIIIHYSSWRLNYELPQDKVNEQLRLEQLDIERARVWSWGLPGNTSGSILQDILILCKQQILFNQLNIRWCWLSKLY